jgi:FkbM family methyltransferase
VEKSSIDTIKLPSGILISGYAEDYIFKKIVNSNDFYEGELLKKWFPCTDNNLIVYDIGANIGNHTIYFSSAANNSYIYSFEPILDNYILLEKNIHDNEKKEQVNIYQLALGEKKDIVFMNFKQNMNYGTASIVSSTDNIPAVYKVQVDSLDSLNLPPPDFIKIDVEGYELNVLKGMRRTLENLKNVSLWIEIDEKTSKDVYMFLNSIGFGLIDFALEKDNNFLWKKNHSTIYTNGEFFKLFLNSSIIIREKEQQLNKQTSRFKYEQNKANNLSDKLKSMTSKFSLEQNKANNLSDELKSMASKFSFEQNKANELSYKLKNTQLEIMSLNSDIRILKKDNNKLLNDLILERREWNEINSLLLQERKHISDMQKELDMFHNSKMIRFMRYWVWHVPTSLKRLSRKQLNKFGNWLYIKLLPHPKTRVFLSKLNSKLKIYKNTQEVVSIQNEKSKQQENSYINIKNQTLKIPKQVNVAMVVDEFSYNSFKYECNAFPLEPENWRSVFENQDIDFFFCESAWAGVDSINHPWRGKIYASIRFPKENRGILLEILSYCKHNNIPTLFWNKEDPMHYEDRVHDFVKTALEFDHIFTTSKECVQRYKNDYGHKNVHLLMFGTQLKLFNPIEKYNRTDEIIFAGSWYKQHPSRSSEMEEIFDKIIQSPYALKIYNRHSENNDPNHMFPEKYLPYIHPRLSHEELDAAYKSSKYALNINTVIDSETMFARRIFELMSSNTLVLTNYSRGVARLFGNNVVFITATASIDLSNKEKMKERCLDTVLSHHTYQHRFEQILSDIEFQYVKHSPSVMLYYQVNNISDAQSSICHFRKIYWENKFCTLLINKDCPIKDFHEIIYSYNNGVITAKLGTFTLMHEDIAQNISQTDYSIYATLTLPYSFIKKALSHTPYLDKTTVIGSGESKYIFTGFDRLHDCLIPNGNIKGNTKVYVI